MADSVTPGHLPDGFELYAGYDDGLYNNTAAIRARFPGKTVLSVTVRPGDNEGDVLDVESGDAKPVQAPAWVVMRRKAGHGGPIVYCSWSLLGVVQAAFANAGVAQPGFWVAGYPAPDGDAIPPGTIGHQWIDHGPYDESIMVDYLPGIDPAPAPSPAPAPPSTPTNYPEDNVQRITIQVGIGKGDGWVLIPDGLVATDIISVVPQDIDPAQAGGYAATPRFAGVTSDNKMVFSGETTPDGTYGFYVWAVGTGA